MIALLYLVVACGAAVMFGVLLHRQLGLPRLTAAWDGGHTAEARCVATHLVATHDHDGLPTTAARHRLEFTTDDGRVVHYEEKDAPDSLAEGDTITVHYAPAAPEQATVLRGTFGRRYLPHLVGAALFLSGCAVTVVLTVVA